MVHCYRLHVATGIKTLKPVSDSSYLLIYMYMYVIIYLAISEFITLVIIVSDFRKIHAVMILITAL